MATTFRVGLSPDVLVRGESRGSACCIWEDGLSTYVLSAAHVLAGEPEASAVQWIGAGSVGLGLTVAPDLYWMPVAGGSLDAGLARVSSAGAFGSTSGYPWAGQVMAWHEIDSVRSVIVCGKHGNVFATLHEKLAPGQRKAPGNRSHGRLLRLKYDSASTIGGDSGAPVISLPEGKLLGMHVARDQDKRFALAVAAADIQAAFERRLFQFRLRP